MTKADSKKIVLIAMSDPELCSQFEKVVQQHY